MRVFNAEQGSGIRSVLRAAIALAVAFGLPLSAEQVGGIMALVEAVLQLGVQANKKWIKP